MRIKLTALIVALCLITTACSPIEQNARNTAAALQGALGAAQAKYQTTCAADKTQTACTTINRAIDGQNALVTAVEAYCGWSVLAPPANGAQPCVPVKGATAGLQTAINNANLFVTELTALIAARGAQ
jgi:hypothetical protein